ncbi:MAG: DNA-processing protein DprA [Planctomycetota bacterium]
MNAPPLHLTAASRRWPAELRELEGSPDELWARGELDLLAPLPRLAIVGSRSPTPYGEAQARRFAHAFAALGVVVVSGLARGIDQAAHAAALAAGGGTIAVLGSGVDRPWPAGPETDRIASNGLLLSEFPPGLGPRRHHFPRRNRLISALSTGVLVVEAAWASGSLITARWAADQGRGVFALPGRVDHPMARGCHRLLREGATLIESPEELLDELGWAAPRPAAAPAPPRPESGLEAALTGETLSAEELSHRTERELTEVLTELVELELAGAVVRAPGGLYRRSQQGG